MKHIHRLLPLLIIILSITSGCRRNDNLSPYGWKCISPEVDSLTLKLEHSWLIGANDSLRRTFVNEMRSIADRHPEQPLLKVRADYWEGRMLIREGLDDEGMALYRRALSANDSAANPYETHRLHWAMEPPSLPFNIQSYEYLLDQTRFFEKSGDVVLAGATAMDMGSFLNGIGQTQRALRWLDRADSLFLIAGMDSIVLANRLNRCDFAAAAGDTVETVRQLYTLMADPQFRKDPNAVDLARYYLYLYGRDTVALFDAYEAVRYAPDKEDLAAMYEGFLAGVYLNRQQLDSAVYYADKAVKKFDLLWNTRMRIDVLAWVGEVARHTGDTGRAQEFLSRRLEEMETLFDETKREDILNHEMAIKLAQLDYDNDRRYLRSRILTISALAIALLAISLIAFIYYRRLNRHKLRMMEQELTNEKTMRKLLATQVALQQRQTLIGDIQRSVASTDDETGHIVDSAIRTYKATAEGEASTFVETFGELHPRFIPRLLEAYPTLTTSDCRLLTLIAVGMSSKQIAGTLGIRPESVKQSRWRLRTKMHLDSDTTLESALAPFLS